MTWKWTSQPRMTLDALAGTRHVVELPIAVDGTPPVIKWTSTELNVDVDVDKPHRVTIDTPREGGFYGLVYEIEGEPRPGTIRVRVIGDTATQRRGAAASMPTPSDEGAEAEPGEAGSGPDRAANDPAPTTLASAAEAIEPEGVAQAQSGSSPPTPTPSAQPGKATYVIDVIRDGVRLHDLRQPLSRGRSVRIGKSSSKLDFVPELDLRDQFSSRDAQRLCSRYQAEVFWDPDGRVVVVSHGTNPMVSKSVGESAPIASPYRWQPDDPLALPGGLVLELVEADNS